MTTDEKIKSILIKLLEEHPADEITVKMVCLESGLSRQTIYNHYYCLMDALEESYKSELLSSIAECNSYSDWVEGLRRALRFFFSRKKVALHLYNSSRKDDFMAIVKKHGETLIRKGIDECSRDEGIAVSEKDRLFMSDFYMYVFMGVVEKYFQDGMHENPDYICSRCDAMMRHHIRRTLRNLRDISLGAF